MTVGRVKARRSKAAWLQVYRAVDHRVAKEACARARNIEFPQSLKHCADTFVELQELRHAADYDPAMRFTRAEVLTRVESAKITVRHLRTAKTLDRNAFAILILFKRR